MYTHEHTHLHAQRMTTGYRTLANVNVPLSAAVNSSSRDFLGGAVAVEMESQGGSPICLSTTGF